MTTEPQIRERRKQIAASLLSFRTDCRPSTNYEFQQAQHWFYCLNEVLGEDRQGEDLWPWLERVAAEATEASLLVWWLCEEDMDAIGEELPGDWPVYLRELYRSLMGRAGRGRLWVTCGMERAQIKPWPDTPIGRRIAVDYGGIVIDAGHRLLLIDAPGIVTDLQLKRQ